MDNLIVQVLVVALVLAGIEFIVPAGEPASRFSPRRALQGVVLLLFVLYKTGILSGGSLNRHAATAPALSAPRTA